MINQLDLISFLLLHTLVRDKFLRYFLKHGLSVPLSMFLLSMFLLSIPLPIILSGHSYTVSQPDSLQLNTTTDLTVSYAFSAGRVFSVALCLTVANPNLNSPLPKPHII